METQRATWSSLRRCLPLTNQRTTKQGQWSPIVSRCLPLPLRGLKRSCNRKKYFSVDNIWIFISDSLFTRNKSCFGKLGKFGINNDRSPGYIRSREPCHYWYLSYQMLITCNMESVSSHNEEIFIKLFAILQAKHSLLRGGVTKTWLHRLRTTTRSDMMWKCTVIYDYKTKYNSKRTSVVAEEPIKARKINHMEKKTTVKSRLWKLKKSGKTKTGPLPLRTHDLTSQSRTPYRLTNDNVKNASIIINSHTLMWGCMTKEKCRLGVGWLERTTLFTRIAKY